jgi:hypothetical protein
MKSCKTGPTESGERVRRALLCLPLEGVPRSGEGGMFRLASLFMGRLGGDGKNLTTFKAKSLRVRLPNK